MIRRDRRPIRFLVLGGTGFFGRSLLDYLLRVDGRLCVGDEVIFASRRPDALNLCVTNCFGVKVSTLVYDVASAEALPECDVVIHAAAASDSSRYKLAPDEVWRTIVDGTRKVLDRLKASSRSVKLIYISSGAVYGRQHADISHIKEDAFFNDVLEPNKVDYALAKRAAERAVIDFARTFDRSAIIARCFSFVGPFLPTEAHFAIGNMMADIEAGRSVYIRASHPVFRSYMGSEELWDALLKMSESSDFRGEAFNVGSGESVELHEVGIELGRRYGVGYSGLDFGSLSHQQIDHYVPDVSKMLSTFSLPQCQDVYQLVDAVLARRKAINSRSL